MAVLWVSHDPGQVEWPGRVLQIAHGRHVTADPAAPPPVRREWAGERPGVLVGLTTSLVVVAAVVSLWQRLGLQRQILWSAARALVQLLLRALVQLLLVGAALTLVVEPGRSMLWSWLWVAIVAYAGDVARRRAPQVRRIMALTIASFSAAAVITSGRCWPQRLFAAGRTLVPIAGMVVGNLMTAMVLVARRLVDELREDNPPETRQTLRTRCAPRCLRRSRAPRPPDWCSCPAR